jgi:cell division protease FtsH
MDRDHKYRNLISRYKKQIFAGTALTLLTGLVIIVFASRFTPEQPKTVSLSEIASAVASGNVEWIEDTPLTGEMTVHFRDGVIRKSLRDPAASLLEQLSLLGIKSEQISKVKIEILKASNSGPNPTGLLLLLILIGASVYIANRTTHRERLPKKSYSAADVPGVRFNDVAGLDENLQELHDIVTFLKEGNQYTEVGAHMPHGILMVGDPGTGKTLIARAIAGEAGVPFFAMSGSEFVEVYVGVGASRMRALFEKARKKAPCIVFIDEIDAVGRARHKSESGAEMEQDQTLNQLLVEMDGFEGSEGVIVLAATNRLDVLDPALTRPGRFDRRLYINRPDVKGRQAILEIHAQGKKLDEGVRMQDVARATPGLVGADLANVVNEAAIIAVRNHRPQIVMADFEEAIEKLLAGGVARKSQVMSDDERRIIAFHEAGHALVMHSTQGCDPVYKITIIPRGQAGGYTMALPESDSQLVSKRKLLGRITGLLGGRAAEELFFQDITSGASNDLKVATQLAEEMVMRLGMDRRAGLRVFSSEPVLFSQQSSQKTFETIDEAVNDILESCYADARSILIEQRQEIENVANALLERETLDRDAFLNLLGA